MRVLYIDGVGPFGGASRSLFEVLRAFPAGAVEIYFVAQRGTALNFYGQVARDVIATQGLSRFDNTQYSHYRGVRWLVLLRELFHLPFTLLALWKAKRRWQRVDVIHANEITEIFPALLAKWLFDVPLVVHVRSPQRTEQRSLRTRWINSMLARHADAIIAINENTRLTLAPGLNVDIIQNSFTPKRAARSDPEMLRKLDSLRKDSLKIGFVGNLHHSKGIYDLLEAAKIVRDKGRDVEFVIVGGATAQQRGLRSWLLSVLGLRQDVEIGMPERVAQAGLVDSFHLLGATTDIQCAYERMDVICFPSHFDAPGRPVFEAAFSGVPSIVSVLKPRPDTLVHGETGLAVPGKDPARLAEAILHFADNRAEVRRMGANAKALAEANCDPSVNARKLVAIYERVLAAAARAGAATPSMPKDSL